MERCQLVTGSGLACTSRICSKVCFRCSRAQAVMRAPYTSRRVDQARRSTRTFSTADSQHTSHVTLCSVGMTSAAICCTSDAEKENASDRRHVFCDYVSTGCNKPQTPSNKRRIRGQINHGVTHRAHCGRMGRASGAEAPQGARVWRGVITGCTVASRDITRCAHVAPQAAQQPRSWPQQQLNVVQGTCC